MISRRRISTLCAAGSASVLLSLVAATGVAIAAPGGLSQPAGVNGCVSASGDGGACATAAGLSGATAVAVSPDGRNVYVASSYGQSLAEFKRDAQTGALTEIGCLSADAGNSACTTVPYGLVAPDKLVVSPDGRSVYVTNNTGGISELAVFDRDAASGALAPDTSQACIDSTGYCPSGGRALRFLNGVALSPDGTSVYAAGSEPAIAEFKRDAGSGALTQPAATDGCVSPDGNAANTVTCRIATGLGWMQSRAIAVSADGEEAFVADWSSHSLIVFGRDTGTGALSGIENVSEAAKNGKGARGLASPLDVAVSPDGAGVYVASGSPGPGGVATFTRDANGLLTQRSTADPADPQIVRYGCFTNDGSDGCTQGRALLGASSVVVSPDGANVYVAARGSGSVDSFARDRNTNELTQLPGVDGCLSDDGSGGLCFDGKVLGGVDSVAVSPDGRNVYAAASSRSAVVVLDREQPAAPPSSGGGTPPGGGGAGTPAGPASDTTAPLVSGFRFSARRFQPVARRHAARRHGSTITYTLSEPASVRISLARITRRRKVRAGTVAHASTAGASKLPFTGRLHRRPLPAGRYVAKLVATDAAGNHSAPVTARFTITAYRSGRSG